MATASGDYLCSGIAAAPGRDVGPARVVGTLSGLEALQPGEVLVCPMSSPDWVPYLHRVQALVTDQGGALSHAAIIARELGLPCVRRGFGDPTRGTLTTIITRRRRHFCPLRLCFAKSPLGRQSKRGAGVVRVPQREEFGPSLGHLRPGQGQGPVAQVGIADSEGGGDSRELLVPGRLPRRLT